MAKKKETLASLSALDALALRKKPAAPEESARAEADQIAEGERPAKSDTKQISAHIPKTLYREVKTKLAGHDDLTLTDLLIKMLSDWVKEAK